MAKATKLTPRQKHGLSVINRVRRGHLSRLRADARRDGNRRVSESDQWQAYALTMARKLGIIPDVPTQTYLNGMGAPVARFFSIRRYEGGRWIEAELLGEWQIPERVWRYDPTTDRIAAENWQPVADVPELAECLL